MAKKNKVSKLRQRISHIINGKSVYGIVFNWIIFIAIILSIICLALELSFPADDASTASLKKYELIFAALFTVEYGLRAYAADNAKKYIYSTIGIVDLLSILPTYLSFILPGIGFLAFIRVLRLLRFARIAKLIR